MTEAESLAPAERDPLPTGEPRRGWKKLILALLAFVFVPVFVPHLRALLPVDDAMSLVVPAMAACSLVGWWAGGRAFSALLWVAVAVLLMRQPPGSTDVVFSNLLRGWALLLAGAFGLACLLGGTRPFFVRALAAVGVALALGLLIAILGPVGLSTMTQAIGDEFARRNAEFVVFFNKAIAANGPQWREWTTRYPSLSTLPTDAAANLAVVSNAGRQVFPALLALQSLAALALAWATYHRLSRQRLGSPLAPLREFRFNDQFVWGLIVGLVILLLPNFAGIRGVGRNLVLFFGALYAIRGLGVLAWFTAPGPFAAALVVGFVMLFAPFLQIVAVLGFLTLGITALGLGVGDTWADWRSRARSTLS
jgi:hypothetical protein